MKIPGVVYNVILVAVFWLAEYLFGAESVAAAFDQVAVWTALAVGVVSAVVKAYAVYREEAAPMTRGMGGRQESRLRKWVLG